ncbi:hypothetical protein EDB89DRAFT_1477120 [Lactarius sanguifluus]|nr:hypothetical protein EDB89DRAFT_1477120 [Lactarius sanguifluus]
MAFAYKVVSPSEGSSASCFAFATLSAFELFFETSTFYTHTLIMFTFVQSTAAKLAAKLASRASRSADTPVTVERSYDPKFYGDLVRRLRAIESRDYSLLNDVRSVGRRVFGKAKKLLTKRTPVVDPADESFCSPGSLDDEEPEMPIPRPPHVQNRRNPCINAPRCVQCRYAVDARRSYGHRYESDPSLSPPSVNSSPLNDYQFQELSDILEESECRVEPEETAYSTILVVDEDGDIVEMGDGATPGLSETGGDAETLTDFGRNSAASNLAVVNPSTTPFVVSPFFCLPTTESTLAPPTPSESESGPSTPRSMPVLVYESISYEEALFAEFKAIIDWKAANERAE